MKYDTIDLCIEKIRKPDSTRLPYFVNTENKEEYVAVREALDPFFTKISVSSYCRSDDGLPDLDCLFSSLKGVNNNTLLIGLSQYLKLKGEKQLYLYLSIAKSMNIKGGKVIILCYQIEKELRLLIENDLRLQNRIIFLGGGASSRPHFVFMQSLVPYKKIPNLSIGFKRFLEEQERSCIESSCISTSIDTRIFNNANCSVDSILGVFGILYLINQDLASQLSVQDGSDNQWEYLLKQLELHNDFSELLSYELGVSENFELIFYRWSSFNSNQQWLYWLVLKSLCKNNSYLISSAISAANLDHFIENVYLNILEIDCNGESFVHIYNERKNLVKYILSPKDINIFCAFSESKGKNKIYYLTDLSELEKKEIVKCLCEYNYSKKQIDDILQLVYPELYKYLLPFYFNNQLLDNYFQDYKYQKITNKIYPEFIELVREHATQREFNYELPTRIEKFEKIEKGNAELYFFDALGVEFLGYITKRSNELGMKIKVSVCRANLPSITSCNKDFLEQIVNPINIKKLDELKHEGEGDYDYRKNKYPIHIIKELEIIDDVLKNAMTKLSTFSKVIIISDHGASRLVVTNGKQYSFDVNSKGTHGGRCCEYTDDIQHVDYATEENGYYVLASYDRFKGCRVASVETHGGATLEEVVIPIIELTIKETLINVRFYESIVVTSYKKKADLVLISNCKLNSVSLKINNKFYISDKNDGQKYHIPIEDIKRAGEYDAEVYEDNNFIESLTFTLKKESSDENELL